MAVLWRLAATRQNDGALNVLNGVPTAFGIGELDGALPVVYISEAGDVAVSGPEENRMGPSLDESEDEPNLEERIDDFVEHAHEEYIEPRRQ